MKYRKVLIVSNMYPNEQFPSYGVFVKNFCSQLKIIGVNFEISFLTGSKSKYSKIIKYIIFYLRTFFKSLFGGFDLVYIHYPSFSALPVIIARKFRTFDIISNVHGTDVIPVKPVHEKMQKFTEKSISLSKLVVVPSEYFKNVVADKYGIKPGKIFVYPSAGINENVFYEYYDDKKQEVKKRLNMPNGSFVIGFVSRITKAKGWDVFLNALEKSALVNACPVTIFIVGSGEDDSVLEDRINELPDHLRNAIKRFPLLDQKELADVYNVLDVFVFPTISSESLGLVAIEAMACGVPVIASDYAAPAFYVSEGVNGYKFEKGNSDELSLKIDKIIQDYNQKNLLKQGALRTAKGFGTEALLKVLRPIFFDNENE